jgi:type IX secretion system PorP/SprF family membrane protein
MKKIILYIIIFITGAFQASAQDIHFSQTQETPLQVNPAFTGGFDGDQRVILNYRNQWASLGAPFKTYALGFDSKIRTKSKNAHLGIGTFIFKDEAGDLSMGMLQANLNIATHIKINKHQTISLGVMGGFVQRSINGSNAKWESQFNGIEYDATLPGSSYNFQNFSYIDLSSGLSWFYSRNASTLSSNDNFWVRIGVAANHLLNPKQKFYTNQTDRMGMRPTFFAQTHIGVSGSKLAFRPQFFYAQQVKHKEITFGNLFRYQLSDASKYTKLKNSSAVSFGLYYRLKDAIIPMVQFEYQSFALGISYDYNTSKLSAGTNGNGGFEISLRFINPNPFGGVTSNARFK